MLTTAGTALLIQRSTSLCDDCGRWFDDVLVQAGRRWASVMLTQASCAATAAGAAAPVIAWIDLPLLTSSRKNLHI